MAAALKTSIEGDLMGGPRYEQLFRATGAVRVGGTEHAFTGTVHGSDAKGCAG